VARRCHGPAPSGSLRHSSQRFAPVGGADSSPRPATLGRSAHEIALEFVSHVRGTPATPAESELLQSALECCTEDPDLVVERDAWVSS